MSRFFTYSWQYAEARKESEGGPLGHAAGSRFSIRGIQPGDFIYIVAVHRGELYLLGKMQVGKSSPKTRLTASSAPSLMMRPSI